jgi:hypothetical protein
MIVDLRDFVTLATIIGGISAPTFTGIWAARIANRNAENAAKRVAEVKEATLVAAEKVSEVKSTLVQTAAVTDGKLDQIHVLVNNQLSQAVERFDAATAEIAQLKLVVTNLQRGS